MMQRFGGVNHEIIFPNIKLQLSETNDLSNNTVYENQAVGLHATVTGKSEVLETLRNHHFVVNGIPFGKCTSHPNLNANGETTHG